MDGTAIIIILAIAGVASVLLFALKGLLDQVPDVLHSATRARDAWDTFRRADVHPRRSRRTRRRSRPPPHRSSSCPTPLQKAGQGNFSSSVDKGLILGRSSG